MTLNCQHSFHGVLGATINRQFLPDHAPGYELKLPILKRIIGGIQMDMPEKPTGDERERLYQRAINDREYLPRRGMTAPAIRKYKAQKKRKRIEGQRNSRFLYKQ